MRIIASVLTALICCTLSVAEAQPAAGNADQPGMAPLGPSEQRLSSEQFLSQAVAFNKIAMDASRVALEKSKSPELVSFAQKIIVDHRLNTFKAEAVVSDMNAKLPQPVLNDQQTATLAELRKAEGAAFDRQFLKAQMDIQSQAVALYTRYVKSGEDDKIAAFAREQLPALQAHLDAARTLANPATPQG